MFVFVVNVGDRCCLLTAAVAVEQYFRFSILSVCFMVHCYCHCLCPCCCHPFLWLFVIICCYSLLWPIITVNIKPVLLLLVDIVMVHVLIMFTNNSLVHGVVVNVGVILPALTLIIAVVI